MTTQVHHDTAAAATTETGLGGLRMTLALVFAVAFVGAAAQLSVPVPGTPVPVSLQDLAVLVVGVVLGPGLGASAMVAYLAAGALGAPVFSNGHAGFPWLLGATGGYLMAYPLAAWIVGHAVRRPRRWFLVLAGAVAAQAVVFLGGVSQLLLLTGHDLGTAVALGMVPFLPGALLKTGLALAFVAALARFGPGSGVDGRPSAESGPGL